jgi:serine/threonine-protein kinase
MGSPQYMSPEQMTSAATVDARSDIWSLGTLLYELLSGHLAFDGGTLTEICARVLQGAPEPLVEYRADISPDLAVVIDRCLEKDRESRYANVAELARALAPFGSGSARASAESIARVVEGAPPSRSPSWSGSGVATMKPTAAEILATVPTRRRRMSGYMMGAMLALAAMGVATGTVLRRTGALHLDSMSMQWPLAIGAPQPAPTPVTLTSPEVPGTAPLASGAPSSMPSPAENAIAPASSSTPTPNPPAPIAKHHHRAQPHPQAEPNAVTAPAPDPKAASSDDDPYTAP